MALAFLVNTPVADTPLNQKLVYVCPPPPPVEYNLIEVTELSVGRPDILSKIVYNDDQYGDLICKINGISNPLELNIGKILVIPETSYIKSFMTRIKECSVQGLRSISMR